MALTNCYECGDVVSNLAEACPHCGAPMENKLIHAANIGKVESVQEMINGGADIDAKNEEEVGS